MEVQNPQQLKIYLIHQLVTANSKKQYSNWKTENLLERIKYTQNF